MTSGVLKASLMAAWIAFWREGGGEKDRKGREKEEGERLKKEKGRGGREESEKRWREGW